MAAAAVAVVSAPAAAQVTKSIAGETVTAKATVEAIEKATRKVTLKNEDGTYEVLDVPDSVKRFDTLKVGDKVTARYYENIVLRLKAPGEKDIDSATAAVTPTAGAKPKGTLASQRAITATITAIDQQAPSITFSGPNGWSYSTRVEDKKALAKVKVGDKVDITWTQAAIVSFDDVK
jgi:hypothetical protein